MTGVRSSAFRSISPFLSSAGFWKCCSRISASTRLTKVSLPLLFCARLCQSPRCRCGRRRWDPRKVVIAKEILAAPWRNFNPALRARRSLFGRLSGANFPATRMDRGDGFSGATPPPSGPAAGGEVLVNVATGAGESQGWTPPSAIIFPAQGRSVVTLMISPAGDHPL